MVNNDLAATLGDFQQALSPEQKAKLISFSSSTPTTQDVLQLTELIERDNAGRKSRVFADRIRGLLDHVQQYCKIVDLCAGPNQIAAVVWGSFKLMLLTLSNFSDYFDKLSERIAQLSNYCPRFSEYEKLFANSSRVQAALADFYALVAKFCLKALGILQESGFKLFSKSTWKSFKSEFKEIEIGLSATRAEVMEELQLASEQKADRLHKLLLTEVEENRMFRSQQAADLQDSKDILSRQMLALKEAEYRQIQHILKEEERHRERLMEKVFNYDYSISLRQTQALRCKGTCRWLLDKPEFRDWIDQSGSSHLWIHGITGSGKTILVGYIVDYLRKNFLSKENTAVIYYFFNSTDKRSLPMSTFLRSILHQVISLQLLDPYLQRQLESVFMSPTGYMNPENSKLIELYMSFYRKLDKGFLLIDGLDEAEKDDQRAVMSFLREAQTVKGARIVVIAQPSVDVRGIFRRCLALQIEAKDLVADIEMFIQEEFKEHEQELSVCSPLLLDKIYEALISGAEGMRVHAEENIRFLWVYLQLKAILDICEENGSAEGIPELFEGPPLKIAELYSLALKNLHKENNKMALLAKKIFQWIVCSRRPLNIIELEEAISIEVEQKSWKAPPKLLLPRLYKMCGNLVRYDKVHETVTLAHHTVLSFLITSSGSLEITDLGFEDGKAEQYLADTCLTYLSFTDFSQALTRTSDMKFVRALEQPANLATNSIPRPLRSAFASVPSTRKGAYGAKNQFDLVHNLRSVLSAQQVHTVDPSFQLLGYSKAYWSDHCRSVDLQDAERLARLEAFIQSTHVRDEWKPWSSIADKENLPYWAVFVWAVQQGHLPIYRVWQTIMGGEQISYWTAFWKDQGKQIFITSCETSNLDSIDIMLEARQRNELLEAEAESSKSSFQHRGPEKRAIRPCFMDIEEVLPRACLLGHLKVVERLLEADQDFSKTQSERMNGGEPRDTMGERAKESKEIGLRAAARGGHLAVAERLLKSGASPDGEGYVAVNYRLFKTTALQEASKGGHLSMVQLLLKAGAYADHNFFEDGELPLHAAAEGGFLEVVERLLLKGSPINEAAVNVPRTALQMAARNGHLEIVECLLDAGATVYNYWSRYGGRTALQAAAGMGRLEMVEYLLRAGAEVNAPGATVGGRTALQAAAGGGHLEVVERLLREGAYVNAVATQGGRTALQAAAEVGHLPTVEHLLQAGAYVNDTTAGLGGRTALQAAAGGGHLPVVERLLQAGTRVNSPDFAVNQVIALSEAAAGGHHEVMERLLLEGIKIDPKIRSIALQEAARGGHTTAVELLLRDVDFRVSDRKRGTLAKEHAELPAHTYQSGILALTAAAGRGHLLVVDRLLQARAQVNGFNYEWLTPLHVAAETGYLAVIERLLQAGAKVNASTADKHEKTPLQVAAKEGHLAVVDRLIRAGAKVNMVGKGIYAETAVKLAFTNEHWPVISRLVEAGAQVDFDWP